MRMHPTTQAILAFFKHDHLPKDLSDVSRPFCELAEEVANSLDGPEATVCLRKLLEAKDCAVRAALAARWERNAAKDDDGPA